MWGADDPVAVYRDDGTPARRPAPDATLVTLDDVGHYPMVEAPDASATALFDVLADRLTRGAMHFTTEHRFPGAPEQVAALMIDPTFEAAVALPDL